MENRARVCPALIGLFCEDSFVEKLPGVSVRMPVRSLLVGFVGVCVCVF